MANNNKSGGGNNNKSGGGNSKPSAPKPSPVSSPQAFANSWASGGFGSSPGTTYKAPSNNNNSNNRPSGGNNNNKPTGQPALTNAGTNPMGAPAGTNRSIQQSLGSAGNSVNYREAAAIAQKYGVSIDRVFNQTAKTGQGAKLGAAAYTAGYQPGANAKVTPDKTGSYYQAQITGELANQQAAFDAGMAELQSQYQGGQAGGEQLGFDWEGWNAQMMAQQAAIWESMDAMNSEFLSQQQQYLQQQSASSGGGGGRSTFSGAGAQDKAAVKRKKQQKGQSGTATNTGVNASASNSGAAGSGLSMGGSNGNGLAIGKNK